MKRTLFLIISLFIMMSSTFAGYAVESSVSVEISALHDGKRPPNRRTFKIEQVLTFHEQDTGQDSVRLWLPRPQVASAFLSEARDSSDMEFRVWVDGMEDLTYRFDLPELYIPKHSDTVHRIVLRYDFFDDSPYQYLYRTDYVPFYSTSVLCSLGSSFFFSAKGMHRNDITVRTNSDDLYFYSTCPMTQTGEREYRLDLSSNQEDGAINLHFLEKSMYDHCFQDMGKVRYDMFVQKFYTVGHDTRTITEIHSNPAVAQYEKAVRYAIEGLEEFFQDTIQRTLFVNIGEYNWQEGYVYGKAYFYNPTIYSVISDSSDLRRDAHILTHELTHCYMPYYNAKGDSVAYLLFEESLVEYVTKQVLYRGNPQALDSAYTWWYNKYVSEEERQVSIITQRQNKTNRTGVNTSFVTYNKTPYVLHQFAKRIGEEYFVELLKGYYRYVRTEKGNITSLSDFEHYLKAHGVSDENWDWLYNAL